jgi:hypothetical protein
MTYTFTQEQLDLYTQMLVNSEQFKGTYDSLPEYEEWLKETFGKDWSEYQSESEDGNLYEYEFEGEFWYGYVTGNFSPDILKWIEDEKKQYEKFLEEYLEDEQD